MKKCQFPELLAQDTGWRSYLTPYFSFPDVGAPPAPGLMVAGVLGMKTRNQWLRARASSEPNFHPWQQHLDQPAGKGDEAGTRSAWTWPASLSPTFSSVKWVSCCEG